MRILFTLLVSLFFVEIAFSQCPAGSTTLSNENFTNTPSMWTLTNGNTNDVIKKTDYLLLENTGGGTDIIQTAAFNVNGCSSLTLQFRVATFGSGNNNPGIVSFDFDMGTDPANVTTQTPTSSTYIDAFSTALSISIPSGATTLTISIVNSGASGRGLRVDNFLLCCLSNACSISSITTSNASACNDNGTPLISTDDYYTLDVSVSFSNAPATGELDLTGDVLSGGGALSLPVGASPLVFIGIRVKADGTATSITASFDAETSCTLTNNSAHAGLASCSFGNTTNYTSADVRINELDSDTPGTDDAEFIELFGTPNLSLNGVTIVFYNGSDDKSYYSYDLDGESLDATGFFIIGNSGAPGTPDVIFTNGTLQNGADAVALYNGNASSFPNGTNVTSTGLIDALVYGTNDVDDAGLLDGLGQPEQIDESMNGLSDSQSIQRGSWFVSTPTPRQENVLPVTFSKIAVSKSLKYNKIFFSTASETNNDYFTIERSGDGRNFDAIGEIKGAGNSTEDKHYEFTDENPLPGINYYRIKQTDYDGQYSYSEIKSVRFKGVKNISITPRTTEGSLHITTDMEDYTISIFTAAGQEVKSFTSMSLDQNISIEELKAGIYFVRVNNGSNSETIRIVKI